MKTKLLTICLISMILSLLAFYVGGAGVAAAVTGHGRASGSVDTVFAAAKILLAISAICGIAGWLVPEPSHRRPPSTVDQ